MSKELDELVLLGDGVLVQKPIVDNKVGSIHLPDGSAASNELLPMWECEVVKVGPGDAKPMPIEVGDIAFLPRQTQYAQVQFDGKTHFIISHHNILYIKRKNQ